MNKFQLCLQPEDNLSGELHVKEFSWYQDTDDTNPINNNYNKILSSSLNAYSSIVSDVICAIQNDTYSYCYNINGTVLTKREQDVAGLAALRLTNKEIADNLYISENTVKSCLKTVFAKLNIRKRTELAVILNKNELR